MNQLSRNRLQYAYLQTRFSIELPQGRIEICPIETNTQFISFLRAERITSCAVITSDNPFSSQLSEEENDRRRAALAMEIEGGNFKYWPSLGSDPEQKWPAERGFFVAGISAGDAEKLGMEFQQNAVVLGDSSGEAEIRWLV